MRSSRARLVLLLSVVAVAAAIRLAWLGSTPLWWDEFVTLGRAKLSLGHIWQSLSYQGPSDSSLDSSPPLLHFILHFVLALGGTSETWVKLPSVVFGVLTVLALYPFGTRLFGGRSGLYASALLTLSLYHLHYSREARPYSLYLLLGIASLHLLLRALETNRFRDWTFYVLAASGSLYASYLGGAGLLAQGGYVAGMALCRGLPRGRLVPAMAGLSAVAVSYLPWLPGHLFHMELIYSPGSDMGLTWDFLARAMLEFTTQSTLFLACAGFGVLVGLRRNRSGLALLLLWLATPLAAALALRTGIAVNPRYLISFVPGLALLAGAGLDGLVKGVSLGLPGRAAALLGLLAAVGLSWPSLTGLPDYYRRDQHSVRDDLLSLAENAPGFDTLAFVRNRHLKVFARWYLPGAFKDLSRSGDLRYRRVMLLAEPDFVPGFFDRPERFGDLTGMRVGLLNVSPLTAAGPYRTDFSNLSFYREAALWDNAGPDLFRKTLSLYDPERPGRAVWRFTAPDGGFAERIPLHCRLRLTRGRATPPPDASVAIAAGESSDRLTVLRTVTQADFTQGNELAIDLDVPKPAGNELAVGFLMDPGAIHGSLEPVTLRLGFPEDGSRASRPVDIPKGRADMVPWTPGVVRTGDASLYAFNPADPRLKDFLAEYPGIKPVADLGDRLVFDPALDRPWLDVPGRKALFAGREAAGLMVRGPFSGQALDLGDSRLELPSQAPEGSTLAVAPGGQGRLWAAMDFTTGPGGPFASFNLAKSPQEPFVSCANEDSCFVTYALHSKAPVRAVRVVYCPEAYGEPGLEKSVALSLSTDGNAYRPLDRFSAKDSELWEGKKRHIVWVKLEKPARRVYLRFDLSGDKARLWAGPETPMRVDAWLDPAGPLPLALPAGPFAPRVSTGKLRLYLSPNPLPDLDDLLARH